MLGAIVGAVVASAMPEVIGNAALGVVGGIATVVGGKLELKQAEEHMKNMEMNQRLLFEHPNDYIQMRTPYYDFENRNYEEVIKNLAGMGFYDININSVILKKGLFEKERKGEVTRVTINGAAGFDEASVFPKDSHVVVDAIVHNRDEFLAMPELNRIRQGAVLYQRPIRRCEYCGVQVNVGQNYCIGCGTPV